MKSHSFLAAVVALVAAATTVPVDARAAATTATTTAATKYIMSFGDSYSETLFDVAGVQPSAKNPLGNPAFPGKTMSGGPNWISYLTGTYNTTLTLTYNYATSYATVDEKLIVFAPATNATIDLSKVKSLVQQVALFKSGVGTDPLRKWTSASTVFTVFMGINDVGTAFGGNASTLPALYAKVLDSYFTQVTNLYTLGARKFLFLTVPPTNRTPLITSLGAPVPALLAQSISQYNSLLNQKATAFAKKYTSATVKVLDTVPVFNKILDNGGAAAQCSNTDGKTCLWYDFYHPGLKIQNAIAVAAKPYV